MKRKGLGFDGVLLGIGVVAAIYVGFWPLILEQWARYSWERVPCHVAATGQYVFEYKGKKYECWQPNMWRSVFHGDAFPATVDEPIGEINGDCYVNWGEPLIAVRFLDAGSHLDQGTGHLVGAGLILLASGAVVWGNRNYAKRISRRKAEATKG